jgi:MFS family permease
MFRSLMVRNFRLFTTGQLVKLIGVWAQFTAQDWLVLQLSDNSPTALGLVAAFQFLPVLLLTLYGGRLADRYDKRKLLIWLNVAFAVAAAGLGVLVTTGTVALWHVFVFAAVTGVINSIETPVRQSFVSELVPIGLLPNALSLSAATFNSARIVGPAVAGLAIQWFGLGPVFLADAAMCTAPVVGLLRMRVGDLHRRDLAVGASRDARIVDGLRYVRHRSDLLVPILLVLVIGMLGFNFPLTLAVLAKTEFHAGASTFGLLTTALAVGALAGALAGTGRKGRPTIGTVLAAGAVFGAMETIVGFAPTFPSAAIMLMPAGFFMVYFAQAANQRVQLGTDAEYRGRVMALYVLVFLGTTPIGAPMIGWFTAHYGPRSGLWLGGSVSLIAALITAGLQLRKAGGQVRVHLRPRPHLHVVHPVRASASSGA